MWYQLKGMANVLNEDPLLILLDMQVSKVTPPGNLIALNVSMSEDFP